MPEILLNHGREFVELERSIEHSGLEAKVTESVEKIEFLSTAKKYAERQINGSRQGSERMWAPPEGHLFRVTGKLKPEVLRKYSLGYDNEWGWFDQETEERVTEVIANMIDLQTDSDGDYFYYAFDANESIRYRLGIDTKIAVVEIKHPNLSAAPSKKD